MRYNRREFFRRLFKPSASLHGIYPPYYGSVDDFKKCAGCVDKRCIDACPEGVLKIENNRCVVDFAFGCCTFCGECALACGDVLNKNEARDSLNARFWIDEKVCLAHNGTMCYSCQDICEYGAIEFTDATWRPIIKEECVSCGCCLGVCPVGAVKYTVY